MNKNIEGVETMSMKVYDDLQTVEGRAKFISEGVTLKVGKDNDGRSVLVAVSQLKDNEGTYRVLEVSTLQDNGWLRTDEYSENGLKVAESFGGRWDGKLDNLELELAIMRMEGKI